MTRLAAIAALLLLGAAQPPAPTPATMAGLPLAEAAGRGAAVPFVEHEAENARWRGRMLGPDRTFTSIAAEASGRRAVLLSGPEDYVEFTLGAAADAIVVRAAVPDGADGRGRDGTLRLAADGAPLSVVPTTSRYGWYYGKYPFTNRPADGLAHHFFDESRVRLPRRLPAGTRVRLTLGGDVPWTAVDLADFELVPTPKAMPAGAVPITRFGADPTGARESSAAIARALAEARRLGVTAWIPPGVFRLERHVTVDRVTLAGAGHWHSVLRGRGAGLYGRKAPRGSTRVTLRDFAIIGEVDERVDSEQLSGIGGAIGGGSVIEDLWLQHHKVGLWFDGPMDGITISRLRIHDLTADGLNFRRGVSNAVMQDSFIRGAGDDGLAMWSHRQANHGNAFRRNTVIAPVLANGIAIYGGRDITVERNLIADTLTQGGGIHLGNRFDAVPAGGTMTFSDNLLVRAGTWDPNWRHGVGALWFYALDAPITARIVVRDNRIVDATRSALHVIGKRIETLFVDGLVIDGAGSFALQAQADGEALLGSVSMRGVARGGLARCADFRAVDVGGAAEAVAPAGADCARLP